MENQLSNLQINPSLLFKAAGIGAAIGLLFISIFVFSVDHPKPGWGEFWKIRPLMLAPLVAALGAVCGYLVLKAGTYFGIPRSVSFIIGLLGFIISLWVGIVLGLAGTL